MIELTEELRSSIEAFLKDALVLPEWDFEICPTGINIWTDLVYGGGLSWTFLTKLQEVVPFKALISYEQRIYPRTLKVGYSLVF